MKRANTILALLAATVLSAAPASSWGESAIPDPPAFFAGLINPQASGTKVSGVLTIVLDLAVASQVGVPDCEVAITNMSLVTSLVGPIVMTVNGPTRFGAFSRDFTDHRTGSALEMPFCLDNLGKQIAFVFALFREEVIPYYFAPCTPGSTCPNFQVKSINNFFQSGRGGYSMEINLAIGG